MTDSDPPNAEVGQSKRYTFECGVCGQAIHAKPGRLSIVVDVGDWDNMLLCGCNDVPMERVS